MLRLLRKGPTILGRQRKVVQNSRAASSAVEEALKFQPGEQVHGYTVKQVARVPELYLSAVELEHDKTGAKHFHVARDDKDNAFGVAFRTTPMDSTGVPHILEHTALCGSEQFPVRDPFFKMLNRSMATFMNAFTANDWTMYPFSTQNAQDFQNLLSVYLDAAFFPQLREADFSQEGWRLEHESNQDEKSPIVFKGIVYNEMKGVFSDSQQLFSQRLQNELLPSHTYGVVSGGDPKIIPDLTWQHLRDFHASHYHPSNARFYTYGDLPLEPHLVFIDSHALQKFDTISPGTEVPLEERWTEPREVSMKCSPNPMVSDVNKQTTVAVSYLLGDVTDTFESFVLNLIGSLLTYGETAPFYKSLIDPNIGSDFAPSLGYDGNTREASFSVGLEGIDTNDVGKVKDIINNTINSVVRNGFEKDRIDMLLHKIELGQRHAYSKFGLYLGVNLISSWNHGADPASLLQTNEHVTRLKECMKENPRFLQDKVKQYFQDNTHRVTLSMMPDEMFEAERQATEKEKLDSLVSALSEADRKKVYEDGLALAELQNSKEDLSCLPTLTIADIERHLPAVDTEVVHAEGVAIQVSEQPTNGVTYFRAISNIRDLEPTFKPYVPLFCTIATKMGAGVMDYRDLSQKIDLHSGGFDVSPHVCDHHTLQNVYEEGILFSSYCLDRNVDTMYDLWTEIFHRLDLSDHQRLQTLVSMSAAELASSMSGSGHVIAMTHAARGLVPSADLRETLGGISQVGLMKKVAEMNSVAPIVSILREIALQVLNRKNLRVSLTCSPDTMQDAIGKTETFVTGLKHSSKRKPMDPYTKQHMFNTRQKQTHFVLPFQVNFVARAAKTVSYMHPDFASLRVLARLMTNKYLHREIREKGGAYGGGATSNSPGIFSFYSYRDPNSLATLEVFDGVVDWARKGDFTQEDIDEAKLAIFQQVDAPVPPGERPLRVFMTMVDDEMKEAHREQLFNVGTQELIGVAEKYLSMENRTSAASLLGPENTVTEESSDWLVKKQ